MADDAALTVVGNGWIGRSLGRRPAVVLRSRRSFRRDDIATGAMVIVASGRSAVSSTAPFGATLHAELDHLRDVLDACERASARRIVVLGSADVVGLAECVSGTAAQAPLTRYAEVKAALEDECILRSEGGSPISVVRLAPVHGPDKARTASLVRLARRRVVPLPAGGRHSIGFVVLRDALRAIEWVARNPAPPVVAVGGGHTPLLGLLECLAAAQRTGPRFLPVPLPTAALRLLAPLPIPDSLHWLLRLSLPREVAMEVPVPITPLAEAAAMLVASC